MSDPAPAATNFERLEVHLKKNSLAARLLAAQASAAMPTEQTVALKKVIADLLNELRQVYAGTTHKQN